MRAQPPSFRRKPESRGAVQRGGARNSTQRLQTPFNSPLHIKGEGQRPPLRTAKGTRWVRGGISNPPPRKGCTKFNATSPQPPSIPPCTSRGRENPRGGKNLPFAPRRGRVQAKRRTQGMHEIQRNTQTTQHPIIPILPNHPHPSSNLPQQPPISSQQHPLKQQPSPLPRATSLPIPGGDSEGVPG